MTRSEKMLLKSVETYVKDRIDRLERGVYTDLDRRHQLERAIELAGVLQHIGWLKDEME